MNWADMNQYERADARHIVDGYLITARHGESSQQHYERAKAEALSALQKRVEQVRCMSFQDMFPKAATPA